PRHARCERLRQVVRPPNPDPNVVGFDQAIRPNRVDRPEVVAEFRPKVLLDCLDHSRQVGSPLLDLPELREPPLVGVPSRVAHWPGELRLERRDLALAALLW